MEVADFLREVGRRIAVATDEPRATDFLLQRLSLAVLDVESVGAGLGPVFRHTVDVDT